MGRAELCLSTPFPGLQCSPGSCEAFPGLWTQFKFISSDRSSLPLVSSPVSGSPALEDPSPGPMGLKASTPAAVFYPCMSPSSLPHIVCVLSRSVMSDSLRPHGLQPARFLCRWNSPGKSTGVGCHALLQGIFLTQGLNTGLQHCRWILYRLSDQGSLYNLDIPSKQ